MARKPHFSQLAAAEAAQFEAEAKGASAQGTGAPAVAAPAPAVAAPAPTVAAVVAPVVPAALAPVASTVPPAAPAVDHQAELAAQRSLAEAALLRTAEMEAELTRTRAEVDRVRAAEAERVAALQRDFDAVQARATEASAQLMAIQREKLFDVDTTGMEHASPEAARELTDKVFKPILTRIQADNEARVAAFQKALDDRDAKVTQNFSKLDEEKAQAARSRTNRQILQVHSDFETVSKTPEYLAFAAEPIPGSRKTWGQELRDAYAEGDAAYINATLTTYKARQTARPTLAEVASLPPSGGAAVASMPAAVQQKYSYEDLEEWKSALRRGELGQKEYSARLAAFKQAETAGLVE